MSRDLFGQLVDPSAGALTDAERKRLYRQKASVPRGHAAEPGTGPVGESCGTCKHLTRHRHAKVYLKCGLMRAAWSHGPKTDIRAGDAACKKWEFFPQ